MNVRAAEPADARAIAVVHVLTWRQAYRGQMPQDYLDELSVERRCEVWQGILAEATWPREGVLVAETGGSVVGFAHVGPARDEDAGEADVGEVYAIYVAPGAWGTGAGRALMTAAVTTLRAARFAEATLWVLATNTRAQRFYQAGGWVVDGVERAEEVRGFPVREVRYRRPLG